MPIELNDAVERELEPGTPGAVDGFGISLFTACFGSVFLFMGLCSFGGPFRHVPWEFSLGQLLFVGFGAMLVWGASAGPLCLPGLDA